jgi:hypothetical protein
MLVFQQWGDTAFPQEVFDKPQAGVSYLDAAGLQMLPLARRFRLNHITNEEWVSRLLRILTVDWTLIEFAVK